MMRLRFLSGLILLLFLKPPLQAQNQETSRSPGHRPTLGLVLEGGGALGLAHVGVITWLEEHHIPVNYVAGTSMGGLVGGAYATGIGAQGLRQLVDSINWDQVMSGKIPYSQLAFRRKEDARDYPNGLEFGFRKGVQFPAGFNSGQYVSLIVDRLALPYSNVGSFDNLPIPFACVATNLRTEKPEVFRSGSLSTAMRATMSIPGVFAPVNGKDGPYADGGLLNNIPIDLAKDMGADIVLGVHLEEAPMDPNASLSSFSVLGRSISVMIAANELRSLEKADLLITVPLSKYTAMDFNDAEEIIKAGYEAAAAKERVLSTFSVDQATWDQYIAARDARRKTDPVPQFVAVSGANPRLSQEVQEGMAGMVDKPIDFKELNEKILSLNGLGRFSSVTYQIAQKNGQPGLELYTEEKSYAPPLVQPLILIDGSNYNNAQFNLGARITFLDLGGFRSELRNDIILFSDYGLHSEYFHPLNPASYWFVAPRGGVDSNPIYLYRENSEIATYRLRDASGGVDLGRIYGRASEIRVGYEGGWQKYSLEAGNRVLPTFSGAFGDLKLQYKMDRLDEAVLPNKGNYVLGTFRWTNISPVATNQYPVLEGASLNYFKLSDATSLFAHGWGGTTFDYATGLPQFSLGGSVRLFAFGQNELLVDKYFLIQGGYMHRLIKMPPLIGSGMYGLGFVEGARVSTSPLANFSNIADYPADIAGAIVVKSLFGPVEFGYAYGTTGHNKFFFRIGRLF